jgi:glycosyltransferase involved in cell wall biosynthesis
MPSYAQGAYRSRACTRAIREVERRSDVVIVQLPFTAPTALLGSTRPRVYHLCADVKAIVETSAYYRGLRGLVARAAATGIDQVQSRLLREPGIRVLSNGAALRARYGDPPGQDTVSSSLFEREIGSVPRRRAADGRFRVLFVGFLRPEKGIDTLLDAFDRLLETVPNAELELVGAPALVDRGFAEIHRRLNVLTSRGQARVLGPQSYGPALFQRFADADVLAVPSRSEGTPRVLVEARAFGCPVVASRVGGIPTSVEDGVDGLLVPPGDPVALAGALHRLHGESGLRERLISNGHSRASGATLEAFTRKLLHEVVELVHGPR